MAVNPDDKSLALFCDFENIALGVRDARYKKFNIQHVLERLLVKGSIVVKKAYCDWERYKEFKGPMHEASFELIEIPHVRMSGKNSADIRMVVDALDLCYTKSHVDTFVIISGDSDFSPLVSKLRENAKTVIGVGVKNSTSDLLISNCDEFIYYDDLVRELERKGAPGRRGGRKRSGGRGRGKRVEDGGDAPLAADVATAGDDAARRTRQDEPQADAGAVDVPDGDARDGSDAAAGEEGRSRGGRGRGRGRGRRTGASRGDAVPDNGTDTDTDTDNDPTDDAGDAGARDVSVPAAVELEAIAARNADADDDEIGAVDFAFASYDDETDDLSDDGREDDAEEDDDDPDELRQEGVELVVETAVALSTERGGKDKLWGSMIKQALKRRRPGFNESYYGYESFSKMLEEAAAQGLLSLEPDDRSGGYIIQDITG